MVGGGRVAINADSTKQKHRTATQSLMSRTFLPPGWKGKWTMSIHTMRCHSLDVPKTAVIRPFRLFEFLRMPFSLKNIPMAHGHGVLGPAFPFHVSGRHTGCPYLQSGTPGTPPDSFRAAQPARPDFKAKCQFGQTNINFTKDGVVPLPPKVANVLTFPRLLTVPAGVPCHGAILILLYLLLNLCSPCLKPLPFPAEGPEVHCAFGP